MNDLIDFFVCQRLILVHRRLWNNQAVVPDSRLTVIVAFVRFETVPAPELFLTKLTMVDHIQMFSFHVTHGIPPVVRIFTTKLAAP